VFWIVLNILAAMDASPQAHAPAASARRPVDEVALDRAVGRLMQASQAPWLHAEVARRMADRLAIVKARPAVVLDWAARLGGGRAALQAAYAGLGGRPDIRSVEPRASAEPEAVDAPSWWSPSRWRRTAAALAPSQVSAGSAQLIWSNMALQAEADPSATIAQWHRALAVDGFLMFSTLGPGSLPELRSLYAAHSWGSPMAPLVDMHDLGDMLVAAGFADPVMDQELVCLNWPTADAALAELRTLGANVDPLRCRGLRTPRWKSRLMAALDELGQRSPGGRVTLTFEIAYGHAFRPPPRARVAPEARVDLADFRAMAREPRR
jgi:malonyl-CoA O-methyltransferase